MLETLIRLYTAQMATGVRSPIPHLAGPPGVGKSETVEALAKLLGVNVHVLNVSRISPMEVEGVQMPVGKGEDMTLRLLHNPLWTNLKEGDIVLLDEFLRGFPEVYNALLDILTSHNVAGLQLPKVFFVAASNSIVAYDKALEDRLLHVFVPDIRSNKTAYKDARERMVKQLGLHPATVDSPELDQLLRTEVFPMYEILDQFKTRKRTGNSGSSLEGRSIRNIVGQVMLRHTSVDGIRQMLIANNALAKGEQKFQYVILLDGSRVHEKDEKALRALLPLIGTGKLTEIQETNLKLNIDLIDAHRQLNADNTTDTEKKDETDYDAQFIAGP